MFNRNSTRWPGSSLLISNRPRVPQFVMNMDEEEYREVLLGLHYSPHAIELEIRRFNAWSRKREGKPLTDEVQKKEPTSVVEKIASIAKKNRTVKGG